MRCTKPDMGRIPPTICSIIEEQASHSIAMNLKLAGYEMAPREQFQKELMDYSQGLASGQAPGQPPLAGKAIYADEAGNHFLPVSEGDEVAALPFIPGSPAQGSSGGFIPASDLRQAPGADGLSGLLGGALGGISGADAAGWLGSAATTGMLGGAPGTAVAGALSTLGLSNPMAKGVLGSAVAAAANAAGLGKMGSLLGGAIGGGGTGLTNAMGAQGLSGLANAAGLGQISPLAGPAAGILGGQLGNLAGALGGGDWAGGLDKATGSLGGLLGGAGPLGEGPGAVMNDPMGGAMDESGAIGGGGGFDPGAVTSQALDQASDQLLSQWQVDDESSAAEHVAHKLVNDNKEAIKGALKDAVTGGDSFSEKMNAMFSGASSGAKLAAARISDPDATVPEIVMTGVATILAEGLPIARMGTDIMTPSMKPILEGSATVLSAGVATARVSSKTAVPGSILKGAPTVLVGGESASIAPPDTAPDADTGGNGGPKGPESPEKGGSGSDSTSDEGDGNTSKGDPGDSTAGKGDDTETPADESTDTSEKSDGAADAEAGSETTANEGEEKRDQGESTDSVPETNDQGDPTSQEAEDSTDSEDSTGKTQVGYKVGGEVSAGKKGLEGKAGGSIVTETTVDSGKEDLGVFTAGDETKVTTETGTGTSGAEGKAGVEKKVYLQNKLGDELYCKASAEGGTGGAAAGAECGIKGALNPNEKIGASVGVSTDKKVFGAGTEYACMPDYEKGTETCTTSVKVTALKRDMKVSYEEKHNLSCEQLEVRQQQLKRETFREDLSDKRHQHLNDEISRIDQQCPQPDDPDV